MEMRIDLFFIKNYLKSTTDLKTENCTILGKNNIELSTIRLLTLNNKQRSDIVYICSPEVSLGEVDPSYSYILVGGDDYRFKTASRLVLPNENNLFAVYECIMDMFFHINNWKISLLKAISNNASITELLELSGEIFGYATISVVDASYLLLGYVQNKNPGNFYDKNDVIRGKRYVRPDDVDAARRLVPNHPVEPFFSTESSYLSGVRTLRVFIFGDNDYFLAWLTITQYGDPLHAYHKELAKFLAECIKDSLAIRGGQLAESSYTGILFDFLSGNVTDWSEIKPATITLKWRETDYYRIMVIEVPDSEKSRKELYHRINISITSLLPSSRAIMMNHVLTVIFHGWNYEMLNSKIWDKIIQSISTLDINSGISNIAKGIHTLPSLYQQALFALSHPIENQNFSYYKKLLTSHILETFEARYNVKSFLHPHINYLAKYDEEHGSELLKSLYYYLYLGHSHSECANQMHIHRSTFLYRLNTIKELLSIDFDDPEECLSMLISAKIALKLKEAAQKIPPDAGATDQ